MNQVYDLFSVGGSFKVHNTWNLDREQFLTKILKTVKKLFLPTQTYGKLQNSFWDDENKVLVYAFKNFLILVRIRQGVNLNRGTWFKIDSVRVNGEWVVYDEKSYRPEVNNLVESK